MCESGLLQIFKTGSLAEARITDWQAVCDEAEAHNVTELLAYLGRQAPPGTVPEEIKAYLDKAYRRTLNQNLLLNAEIEDIIALLYDSGVRCIVLKGIRLAERIYGDPGVRKSGDVDLLVEADRLDKAIDLLLRKGYVRIGEEGLIKPGCIPLICHLKLEKPLPGGICRIELHIHFTSPWYEELNMREIWKRSEALRLDKTPASDLAPVDLLFYLCLHAVRHDFDNLRHILDVAYIIKVEGNKIDWSEFIRLVKKYRAIYRIYSALFYAATLLAAPVPVNVMAELQPPHYIRRRLNKECLPNQLPEGISYFSNSLISNEGISRICSGIWQRVFPSARQIRLLYRLKPATNVWSYYPLRWRDILKKPFSLFKIDQK